MITIGGLLVLILALVAGYYIWLLVKGVIDFIVGVVEFVGSVLNAIWWIIKAVVYVFLVFTFPIWGIPVYLLRR